MDNVFYYSNKKGKFPPWRKFTFIFREAKTIIRAWRDHHSAQADYHSRAA